MSMDEYYQRWRQQADDLHFSLQDCFDDPNHQNCQELKVEMRELLNDFSQSKSPRVIEIRIAHIIDLLEPARNGSSAFMSTPHAVQYHDTFERMRRDVHSHPHYN